MPFVSLIDSYSVKNSRFRSKYDFLYIARGEVHMSHSNLVETWSLLANARLKSYLALTVNLQLFPLLSDKIA